MMNMIDNNVPGLYYFFIGEEYGTVGSNLLVRNMQDMLSQYDRCIAFDRHGTGSIITRQMGKNCCSSDFSNQLSQEFAKNGMKYNDDPYGVWTDSALFMGVVPECTNISVGYFKEHTKEEEQDLDYLLQLAVVATKINWESLVTNRTKVHFDTEEPEIVHKPGDLPMYKLHKIMDEVDDILYDETSMFASNLNFFSPEKEMTYFNVNDLRNNSNFSVYLHTDGSITMTKNGVKVDVKNLNTLKELKERGTLKKLLKFKKNISL